MKARTVYDRGSFVVSMLVVIAFFSGCRSYGGYDSEQQIRDQIHAANREFAGQLESAKTFYTNLQQSGGKFASGPSFETLGLLVKNHQVILKKHESWAEATDHSGDHQFLKRHYGAIIMEQQLVIDQYQKWMGQGNDSDSLTVTGEPTSAYHRIPPFFVRKTRYESNLTLKIPARPDSAMHAQAQIQPDTTTHQAGVTH